MSTKSCGVKLKSQPHTSNTEASLLPKLKPVVKLNFNGKRDFGKETPIKLFKVADEIFHSNSTTKQPVTLPVL